MTIFILWCYLCMPQNFTQKNFNIYFFIYCPQKAQQTLGTRRNFQQQLKEMLDNETPVKEVSYTVGSWSLQLGLECVFLPSSLNP